MRDKPHPNFRLEWPGGIVPEWARPQRNGKNRRGPKGTAGKRERLQKVMAQSGFGSRRNIEILIAQGHVTVNGQVAKLGDAVGPGDKVKLDGQLIRLRYGEELPRVLLYHKPEGEIVTRDDPEGRATVFEKLPKVKAGRWVSVGRLDLNTGGLLIFTTNGELANRLTHPRFEVEREYAVRVLGELTEEQRAKLLAGVEVDGESCAFDSIEDRGGEGSNHWYHVVLREGRNREVRKMFEAAGLMVSRLMRVRFGPIALPTFLKRGMMKELDETQVQELLQFAGVGEPEVPGADEHEEDEHDNIGNRIDYHANRDARPPREVDGNRENLGNRVEAPPEVDGNRGSYGGFAAVEGAREGPREGGRGPKAGRRGPGGKGFFKKRAATGTAPPQGQPQGQPPHRKHGKPKAHGQGGQGPAQGQAQGQAGAPEGAPRSPQGQGAPKPGRNRRNKNRHRNRGAQPSHGEQQPTHNGNRDPF